jgi:hypothetical protein
MNELAKIFFVVGLLFLSLSGLILLISKIPFTGRLPGDIVIRRENFTFYFPIMTSILLSLLLSLILFLFQRR